MALIKTRVRSSANSKATRHENRFPKRKQFKKYLKEYERLLEKNPQKPVPGTRAFYVWEIESLGRVFSAFEDDKEVCALLASMMVYVHEKDVVAGR
jgi:hypothetical protein